MNKSDKEDKDQKEAITKQIEAYNPATTAFNISEMRPTTMESQSGAQIPIIQAQAR